MTNDEDPKEFQKRIGRIQVWSGATITVGGVAFGIGASMWLTAFSILGSTSVLEKDGKDISFLIGQINFFNTLGQFFFIVGLSGIIMGFFVAMYLLGRKPSEKKSNSRICDCGNNLPCPIHENKPKTPI